MTTNQNPIPIDDLAAFLAAMLDANDTTDADDIFDLNDPLDFIMLACTTLEIAQRHDDATKLAELFEYCPIHHCDYRICIDDDPNNDPECQR